MQAADNVKFGDCFSPADPGGFPYLLEGHRVGFRILGPLAKRAQPAARHAHIGGIDVAVHVEVGDRPVQPLANEVGYIAERENVRAPVHRNAIVVAQTDAGFDLIQDRLQPAVFKHDLHREYPPPKTRRITRSHNR